MENRDRHLTEEDVAFTARTGIEVNVDNLPIIDAINAGVEKKIIFEKAGAMLKLYFPYAGEPFGVKRIGKIVNVGGSTVRNTIERNIGILREAGLWPGSELSGGQGSPAQMDSLDKRLLEEHGRPGETLDQMLARDRAGLTWKQMRNKYNVGTKILKRLLSDSEDRGSVSQEERERYVKEAADRKILNYVQLVFGDDYVEKLKRLVELSNVPYIKIAAEYTIPIKTLRKALRLLKIHSTINDQIISTDSKKAKPKRKEVLVIDAKNEEIVRLAQEAYERKDINDREYSVLMAYYGYPTDEERPSLGDLREIFHLSISKERIRQIKDEALRKIGF